MLAKMSELIGVTVVASYTGQGQTIILRESLSNKLDKK